MIPSCYPVMLVQDLNKIDFISPPLCVSKGMAGKACQAWVIDLAARGNSLLTESRISMNSWMATLTPSLPETLPTAALSDAWTPAVLPP
jgi:hypothetical protein